MKVDKPEEIKKIVWGVWLHAFNESKMTTPPTWLEDTVEPVDPNDAIDWLINLTNN